MRGYPVPDWKKERIAELKAEGLEDKLIMKRLGVKLSTVQKYKKVKDGD